MALPSDLSLVDIVGTYVDYNGDPLSGTIEFSTTTRVVSAGTSTAVLPAVVIGTLNASGQLKAEDGVATLKLASTDDPDGTPVGWTWKVTEKFTGYTGTPFNLLVPSASTSINLPAVSPNVAPVTPGATAVTKIGTQFPAANGTITLVAGQGLPATMPPDAHAHAISAVTGLQAALDGKEASGAAATAMTAHTGASDPHPQYLTSAEGAAAYAPLSHTHIIANVTGLQTALDVKDALGAADAAVAAHLSAGNPHPEYLTPAEADAVYAPLSHTHTAAQVTGLPLTASFSAKGSLAALSGTHRWYNDTGRTLTVTALRASVGTSPSSTSSISVTAKKNGAAFSPSLTVSIAAETNTGVTAGAGQSLAAGDYVTVDVAVTGASPGEDLTVILTLAAT